MASSGNQAKWSDITALYTALNTARKKFSFATVSVPAHQGQPTNVSDITQLNSFITQMQSNANLKNIAKPVTPPVKGELLRPLFVNTLTSTITNIQNANNFGNSSFGNSSFGNTGWSNSSWGNSSFSNSSWTNSGWSNSSWFDGNADCWWA